MTICRVDDALAPTDEIRFFGIDYGSKRTMPKHPPDRLAKQQECKTLPRRQRTDKSNSNSMMIGDGNENEYTSSPSTFPTVYQKILSLWLASDLLCGRIIRVRPPLVGQITVAMLVWRPHGLGLGWMDDEAFRFPLGKLVILGEVGLVLLLFQAGLAMDLHVLQQVGSGP
jgi:hypothetical protein